MSSGLHNRGFEEENGRSMEMFKYADDNSALEMVSGTIKTDPEVARNRFSSKLGKEPPVDPKFSERIKMALHRHQPVLKLVRVSILNLAVGVYFAWATYHYIDLKNNNSFGLDQFTALIPNSSSNTATYCQGYCGIQWCDGYGMLLLLTFSTYFGLIYYKIFKPKYGATAYEAIVMPMNRALAGILQTKFVVSAIVALILAAFSVYIYLDTIGSRERIRSLMGIFILFGFGYVFSTNRSKINWRPVICGAIFQFLLGIFCIRMELGRSIFACVGSKATTFLKYADNGSKFVFGEFLVVEKGVFAFSVLPVIFFFSLIISVLYYWNVMQWIVQKLGWILQAILGTTVCESVVAASNVFLGMGESPLLIGPYIQYLTASELHAIMASGFATVAGSVMAAYISYGAEASHLITSTVMAAPAALAFSKLFFPEEEESKTKSENFVVEKSKETSVLDAASNGAMAAIPLILGVIANLVAFVSFIAFMDGALGWLGYLIGQDYLSFEWILAKVFWPLAYILGIPFEDCENVAKVIASKTIINEFVAYQRLGEMKKAKLISLRSSAIATFAVCGFANPSSLGILIGMLNSMCPEKKEVITGVSVRALISGCIICFINASIAGLLMNEEIVNNI